MKREQQIEFWAGTYHGRHDGAQVTTIATATFDGTSTVPYSWTCTCGASKCFSDRWEMDTSAWQHTHPTGWARLRQWAARLLQPRS
ncbi:hypothetical protein [Streptomyces flavofungini]|uniref:hypothetical protein n=1 Tax=Streptomyces flavofungini TaxID=68200 RepID=UPI0025B094CF|nr:hypothetical protein [Streptomyces flavofungini]WJV51784.1 hypothetical protein QUY26_39860 [Streptomyces flavofungini]